MRRCFTALYFSVGLQLPVFSRVPFLVSELACLVCTVQNKVVSIQVLNASDIRFKFQMLQPGFKNVTAASVDVGHCGTPL